jgi:hypothetical protein
MDFDDDLLRVLNFWARDGGEFDYPVGPYDHCLHLGRNCHCQGKEVSSRGLKRIAGRLRLERMLKGTRHSHCVTFSKRDRVIRNFHRRTAIAAYSSKFDQSIGSTILRRADRKKVLHQKIS